jgi:GDP-4-dehydro-6-deoxy-D-mannose reductase
VRILVTGVGGFVGAHLARKLRARGDEVIGAGVADAPPGTRALLAADLRADITDPASIAGAVAEARPDAVVHLAAQSSAGRSFERPVETFRVNAAGTWHLLEAVRQRAPRARVLVVGTGEVYGPQPEGSRVAEDAPFAPVSPYALAKAAADAMAEVAGEGHGLDVVRTRSFSHSGPGQTTTFVIPSIARQIAEAESGRGEAVVRVGNLEVTRDISDVRDVAEAYVALLERGRPGAVYNVGSGRGVKLTEVAAALVARARRPVRLEVEAARMRPADVPWLVADASAIARDTGWRAATPLDTTLDDVLAEQRASAR